MRKANFRDDVLWALAYKLGYDPRRRGLLKNQAEALVSFINAWVGRTWDNFDRPEWTVIEERTPDQNHYVAYQQLEKRVINRPLKVYLVDPQKIQGPSDTHFDLLDKGLHVGWDHGPTVWIKFIPEAPTFTAEAWDTAEVYQRGELTYSPVTGQCYKSRSGANQGNDPTGQQGADPLPLTVAVVQTAQPEQPAIQGRPQITKVTQHQELLDTWQTQHTWDILDATGAVIGSATYQAAQGEAAADILMAIYNSLTGNAALSAFTFTLDTATLTIQVQADQFFAVRSYYFSYTTPEVDTVTTGAPGDPLELVYGDDAEIVTVGPAPVPPMHTAYNTINNVQYYVQAVPFSPALAQIIQLSMSAQSATPKASYELTFIDTSSVLHSISYTNPGGSALAILQGIVNEIQASSDPFFNAMSTLIDPALLTLKFSSRDMVTLNAEIVPMGNPWWDIICFPRALVDTVVTGAYSDALKESGQTDKGQVEQQGASAEDAAATQKQIAPAYTNLTDQEKPAPRYRTA